MLCTGVPGGRQDIIKATPAVPREGAQVGVVSRGYECVRKNVPGVYSRGTKNWIDATICAILPPLGHTDGTLETIDTPG
jgi:hypothetical protein